MGKALHIFLMLIERFVKIFNYFSRKSSIFGFFTRSEKVKGPEIPSIAKEVKNIAQQEGFGTDFSDV